MEQSWFIQLEAIRFIVTPEGPSMIFALVRVISGFKTQQHRKFEHYLGKFVKSKQKVPENVWFRGKFLLLKLAKHAKVILQDWYIYYRLMSVYLKCLQNIIIVVRQPGGKR